MQKDRSVSHKYCMEDIIEAVCANYIPAPRPPWKTARFFYQTPGPSSPTYSHAHRDDQSKDDEEAARKGPHIFLSLDRAATPLSWSPSKHSRIGVSHSRNWLSPLRRKGSIVDDHYVTSKRLASFLFGWVYSTLGAFRPVMDNLSLRTLQCRTHQRPR